MLKRIRSKMEEKNKNTKNINGVCKKCGCELRSNAEEELCVNCIKEQHKKWKKLGVGAVGVAAVVPGIIKAAPKVIATVGKIVVKK